MQQTRDRYSAETLRKVIELASRLEAEKKETLTVPDIHAIGREVGIDPRFIEQALEELHLQRPIARRRLHPEWVKGIVNAWWGAGWTLPFILAVVDLPLIGSGMGFFLGWGIYIGGGLLLEAWRKAVKAETATHLPQAPAPSVSRKDLLQILVALQRSWEAQKVRRAVLSMDVVGCTEMKRGASELDAEYSFTSFFDWAEGVIRRFGGVVQSTAGDGLMALFTDDASAVQAALALQEGIGDFNIRHNRLTKPFRIRCGISAGEVPIDESASIGKIVSPVIDRAAELRTQAEPGGILVGGEVQAAALVALGQFKPYITSDGSLAFRWP
ncbi:MAG: adenylate/guanylate cyclase domain-containing protein [Armatimonadetes bacterium]|nr:adenylate/guanylate cyclase domain-containing protein [Armatimonadota bacterium]MDW8123006.1 adenylate/guanylate cyclase domain-containing protein [Armatimonadota bacterium]